MAPTWAVPGLFLIILQDRIWWTTNLLIYSSQKIWQFEMKNNFFAQETRISLKAFCQRNCETGLGICKKAMSKSWFSDIEKEQTDTTHLNCLAVCLRGGCPWLLRAVWVPGSGDLPLSSSLVPQLSILVMRLAGEPSGAFSTNCVRSCWAIVDRQMLPWHTIKTDTSPIAKPSYNFINNRKNYAISNSHSSNQFTEQKDLTMKVLEE